MPQYSHLRFSILRCRAPIFTRILVPKLVAGVEKGKKKKNTASLPFSRLSRFQHPCHACVARRRRRQTAGRRRWGPAWAWHPNCQRQQVATRDSVFAKSAAHVAPARAAPYPVQRGFNDGPAPGKRKKGSAAFFSEGPARPHHIGDEVGGPHFRPPSSPSTSPPLLSLPRLLSPPVPSHSPPTTTTPRLAYPPPRPDPCSTTCWQNLLLVLLSQKEAVFFSSSARQQRKLLGLSHRCSAVWVVPRLGRAGWIRAPCSSSAAIR
jgi:hypothetical protein